MGHNRANSKQETLPTKDNDVLGTLGFAFTVASVIVGVAAAIPGLGPFAIAGLAAESAAYSLVSVALKTLDPGGNPQSPSYEDQFNMFANLSASLNALGSQIQESLQDFVDHAINHPPGDNFFQQWAPPLLYNEKADEIPSLLFNGSFASPLPGIDESVAAPNGYLTAAISAPIINAHWQLAKTVVVKASATSLDGKYCDGNNYAPSFAKFCDDLGVLWAIVTIPQNLKSAQFTTTPGLEELYHFGLNVSTVSRAAYSYYKRNHFDTNNTRTPEMISSLASLDPRDIQKSDLAFFNLPVCRIDYVPQLSISQIATCAVSLKSKTAFLIIDILAVLRK